ncbi:Bidirectional sugar transporter NEC1 [Phytophthora citrophthora]|uniref:Bidirectional sugar transporter NEC1 n=1 Tax=Phytophthora citrophthora TaxID=4793 RepID=A0AAD9G887_9STRA|nr:Bidirectional sugar transporter NEC1 [Phytophthora citrophthora]
MYGGAGVMVVRVWVTCSTLAMAYLPSLSVCRIYKKGDIGAASIVPLLSLLINSHVWVMYAYMCKTWFPSFPVFLTGDICALCYLFIYWWFSPEKTRVGRIIAMAIGVLLLPSIYVIVAGLGYTNQTRAEVGETEGYICDVVVVALHLVMLKNLLNVVKTRSTASLNLRALVVGTINTYGWFTFGVTTSNWIISGPHVFVMALHTAGLVLYFALRPSPHAVTAIEEEQVIVSIELSQRVNKAASVTATTSNSPGYRALRSPMAAL